MEPTQGLQRNKIALLIDFDNVILGIDDPGFDVEIVVNALRARGIVVLGRAYGDWYRHNRHRRKLMEQGIDLIETPVFGPIIKNSADMHMALDAFELAHTQPHIDTFCIVSGDSDFLPLIKRLQGRDKNVIVIAGHKFTSELVRRNCNEYLAYENLLAASVGATEDVTTIEGAFQLLERTINTLQERSMEVRSSTVKQMMLQLNPAFSERTVGCSQFKQFLDRACAANFIRLGRRDPVSGEFNVLLPDENDIETRVEAAQSTLGAGQPSTPARSENREERGDGRVRRRTDRRFPNRRDEANAQASAPAAPAEGTPAEVDSPADSKIASAQSEATNGRSGDFVDGGSALGRVPLRRGRLRFTAKNGRTLRATPRSNGVSAGETALAATPPIAPDAQTTDATALDLMPEIAAEVAATDAVEPADAVAAKPTPKKRAPRTRKRKTADTSSETSPAEAAPVDTAPAETAPPETTPDAPHEADTASDATPAEPPKATPPARARRTRSPRSPRTKAASDLAAVVEAAPVAAEPAAPKSAAPKPAAPKPATNTAAADGETNVGEGAPEANGEEAKKGRRVLRRRHGSRR